MTAAVDKLPPDVIELLDAPVLAHMSTSSPEGHPQASLVWFERVGSELVLFIEQDSLKARYLSHNPHSVLVVVDPERELAAGVPPYVRLSGTVRLTDPEPGIEDRLARRYGSPTGYVFPRKPILNAHLTVERVSGIGPYPGGECGGWVPPDRPAST